MKRPVHLHLTQIHFPITAVVSIVHRISGIFLFLVLPLLIYGLQCSLYSEMSFDSLGMQLNGLWCRLLLLMILSASIFHFLFGLRHIIMDFGCGDSLRAARFSAIGMLVFFAVCCVFLMAWIW